MTSSVTSSPPIDVAVGVLIRDDGRFLLAQRPAGKPMAGWWEFPGGKVEAGESVFDALVREFDEELGLRVAAASPWVTRVVVYPHATVRLHFWRSFGADRGWHGEPESREGQAFRWEAIDRLTTEPWLEGALPVERWLKLPATYAISNAAQMGVEAFVAALEARCAEGTLQQLQLREPTLDEPAFAMLFDQTQACCRRAGVRLLVSSRHPRHYAARADGLHLTSHDLARAVERPAHQWVIASCHDAHELAHAGALGLDAALLGPVAATATHPGAVALGWEAFATIVAPTTLPVYALGGLAVGDLRAARQAGAHGIAMIRGAWS